MLINKIGALHLAYGTNYQDAGLCESELKIVCDGCSEGAHSEVGTNLFVLKFPEKILHFVTQSAIGHTFDDLVCEIGDRPSIIKDFLSFTVLVVTEESDRFCVHYCGDGYIIAAL